MVQRDIDLRRMWRELTRSGDEPMFTLLYSKYARRPIDGAITTIFLGTVILLLSLLQRNLGGPFGVMTLSGTAFLMLGLRGVWKAKRNQGTPRKKQ